MCVWPKSMQESSSDTPSPLPVAPRRLGEGLRIVAPTVKDVRALVAADRQFLVGSHNSRDAAKRDAKVVFPCGSRPHNVCVIEAHRQGHLGSMKVFCDAVSRFIDRMSQSDKFDVVTALHVSTTCELVKHTWATLGRPQLSPNVQYYIRAASEGTLLDHDGCALASPM